ncbi:MAG TPA: serine/threonine-protein kinase, partial [Kofleriaceae bacterium]|nr:serine/threonine-protein kinase [Kofleriaceae bacterium]
MAGQTCGSGGAACIAADQALAFVDGQLAPAERAAIEHRIEACAGCRAAVAEAARRAGAELERDAGGRTAVQRPAVTAAGRGSQHRTPPGAGAVAADRAAKRGAVGADRAAERGSGAAAAGAERGAPTAVLEADRPVESGPVPARITGREATTPALLLDEHGEVIGAVRRAGSRPEPGMASGDAAGAVRRSARRAEAGRAAGAAIEEAIEAARRGPARAETALTPGAVVGRYVVERPLGAGGMGVVSLARDPELHRPVVIKLVHPEVGASEGGEDFEARLRREAQAMAQVSHANVVQIFDIGRLGDRVFLAMEFVDGQTLDHWLRERRRTVDEVIGVFRQAGAGLAAAHRAGLVHRDFKPSNVLVGRDGVVKVTDFGLARSVASSDAGRGDAGATRQLRIAARVAPEASGVHAVLTQANAVLGTPAYMAPEQAAGAAIDARTDQYALAVTLLDALVGQPASRRRIAPDNPAAIEVALDNARVAAPVRAAIVRALAKDPGARFPAVDDLLRVLAPAASPRRSRAALGVAGVALCGIAVAAWFALGRRESAPACTSDAPARWGAARDGVIAALGNGPRLFTGWDAGRIAEAIDGAVEALAAADAAQCRGAPVAGTEGAADCIARRKAALAAAIAAPGSPPLDDPWSLVGPIERCDPAGSPATAELRGKLRGASPVQAHEIAEAAHKAGDERLAADASEAEGVAALAAGDAARAAQAFRAMNAAGLQIGSVAVQGRVLLHLIELRRATGEYDLAVEHGAALDALLARSGNAARDVLPVARTEAEALGDLGDVAAAFAAWDRAEAAASSLRDHDAQLAVAIGRAWAMYALRFDLDGARAKAREALEAGAPASPGARATALGVIADLAIAAGDGPGAAQAFAQAQELVAAESASRDEAGAVDPASRVAPAPSGGLFGRVRAQRVRALQDDVDGALTMLAALAAEPGPLDSTSEALATARIAIARGQLLLAGDHASEARDVLDRAMSAVRGKPFALPIVDRIELQLAACEARLAATRGLVGDCQGSRLAALVEKLHPKAPARVRVAELEARGAPADQPRRRAELLQQALEILLDIQAAP